MRFLHQRCLHHQLIYYSLHSLVDDYYRFIFYGGKITFMAPPIVGLFQLDVVVHHELH